MVLRQRVSLRRRHLRQGSVRRKKLKRNLEKSLQSMHRVQVVERSEVPYCLTTRDDPQTPANQQGLVEGPLTHALSEKPKKSNEKRRRRIVSITIPRRKPKALIVEMSHQRRGHVTQDCGRDVV